MTDLSYKLFSFPSDPERRNIFPTSNGNMNVNITAKNSELKDSQNRGYYPQSSAFDGLWRENAGANSSIQSYSTPSELNSATSNLNPSHNSIFSTQQARGDIWMYPSQFSAFESKPTLQQNMKMFGDSMGYNTNAPEFKPNEPYFSSFCKDGVQRMPMEFGNSCPPSMNYHKESLNDRAIGIPFQKEYSEQSNISKSMTIRPAPSSARGTSSTQGQRQDNLVKVIYQKLVTCQANDCRKRHSCLQCLQCDSLHCESCARITMQALVFESNDENDEDAGWEPKDLKQIPGYCPNCGIPSRYTLNLAMMKLLMDSDQYKTFSRLLRVAQNIDVQNPLMS